MVCPLEAPPFPFGWVVCLPDAVVQFVNVVARFVAFRGPSYAGEEVRVVRIVAEGRRQADLALHCVEEGHAGSPVVGPSWQDFVVTVEVGEDLGLAPLNAPSVGAHCEVASYVD